MSQKPIKLEFDDGNRIVYIRRMDPFVAMEVMADLQKYFAAPLAAMIEARGAESDEEAMQVVMSSIEKVSAQLDSASIRKVIDMLLFKPECISFSVDGCEAKRLDDAKKGMALKEIDEIVYLIIETLKHNYADFLSQMLDRFGGVEQLRGNLPDNSATN